MNRMKNFFNTIGRGLLTPEIYNDEKLSRRFYKYFLIGILVRLLLLPFFFQRDLLSTYQRAAETVFAGNMTSDFHQILIPYLVISLYGMEKQRFLLMISLR